MTVPDWLQLHGGNLRPGLNENVWTVVIGTNPQYKLTAGPASGQYTCVVTQTNNGKRLDSGVKYPSPQIALQGGLQELRTKLGW